MNADITSIKVSKLVFDPQHPRLVEFGLTDDSPEREVIRLLWDTVDVHELAMSIASSGFFRHEPLIVAQKSQQNIVLEGHRRLAAVKALLDPGLVDTKLPVIASEARNALESLPVIFGTRESAWRCLGFKHVNGPAKWSSYAKSKYITDVHRNFGIALEDIAKQLGDTHKTVQRLFRGFMVLEEAERIDAFKRGERFSSHFAFSHLYTGLDYPGISTFIGLQPENDGRPEPVKKKELRELCIWLYGSRQEEVPPIIRTQNPHLRQLDAVVRHKEALAALRAGQGLAHAFELSRPSSTVFEEALFNAKRDLQKAHALFSMAYDGSEELLRITGSVADLADDLYKTMYHKLKPGRKVRIAEDS